MLTKLESQKLIEAVAQTLYHEVVDVLDCIQNEDHEESLESLTKAVDVAKDLTRLVKVKGRKRKNKCSHSGTDGTVPCKDCGLTASDFITAAYDWLSDNEGAKAEDPGYFETEE